MCVHVWESDFENLFDRHANCGKDRTALVVDENREAVGSVCVLLAKTLDTLSPKEAALRLLITLPALILNSDE